MLEYPDLTAEEWRQAAEQLAWSLAVAGLYNSDCVLPDGRHLRFMSLEIAVGRYIREALNHGDRGAGAAGTLLHGALAALQRGTCTPTTLDECLAIYDGDNRRAVTEAAELGSAPDPTFDEL